MIGACPNKYPTQETLFKRCFLWLVCTNQIETFMDMDTILTGRLFCEEYEIKNLAYFFINIKCWIESLKMNKHVTIHVQLFSVSCIC